MGYLAHRGPDTTGILKMPQIVLGHTRLSILDLSERATQPKWSEDGSVALTYNGEVYNFRTLGSATETSDTVALVEWLARCGPGFDPAALDGMYAFAAYFPQIDQLVLCRDPAGIKPLYFAVSPDGDSLAFASEIKGFFGIEWFKACPNGEASVQREFLQYGHALPRKVRFAFRGRNVDMPLVPTLLEGVWQVCPGQRATFSLGRAPLSSFTELKTQDLSPLAALTESVKEQAMSDVEVGVQLSGGIDSSLVAWEYALANSAVHGFYVSVPFEGLNEDRWAQHAASRLRGVTQFTFHQINATREEVARVLPSVAWHMDEPAIRHPNAIGVYLLCEYVRQQTAVKVLLTGEGADEIFAGYSWHDGKTWDDYDRSRRIFDLGGCELVRQHLAIHRRESVLVSQLSYDRDIYLPPILARQDRMSMAHSLEARVPFLSNRFLAMPAPIVPGKHVLKRRAAEIFGEEFARREKCGFGFPLPWLAEFEPPKGSLDWLAERPTAETPFQRWALAALGMWSQLYLNGGWKQRTPAPASVKHIPTRLSSSSASDPRIEQARRESAAHFQHVLEGKTPPVPARILEREGPWALSVAAGQVWRLDTTQWLDNEILQNGLFELESTRWVHQVVKPGMTVLDVGANIGYYTLQFSQLAGPTGRVIAFEPSARFNQRLRDHLRRNHCENVTVVDCGLADGAKQLPLFGGGDSATLGWHDDARQPVVQETIALRSLDDWLAENPQPRIDFIKVDIDGAEPLFVRGARQTLSRFRPILLMEFMQLGLLEFGSSVLSLARQLSELGYVLISEKSGKPWSGRAEFLREAMNCSHSINVFCIPAAPGSPDLQRQQEAFQVLLKGHGLDQGSPVIAGVTSKWTDENGSHVQGPHDKLTEVEYWDDGRSAEFKPWCVEGTNFSAVLEKYLPVNPEFTCAEIGAYPGAILCDMAKRFRYKPVAIEYSKHAEHIRQLLRFNGIDNGRIINEDFFKVTGEQFDVVTSFGFVEHFEDYQAVIAKHFELLKPGGCLVISVPRISGFQGLLYEHAYTPKTWKKISTSHNPLIMNLHELRRTVARQASEVLFADYVLGDLVYFSWTDDFVQHDRRWLVRYLNQMQKHTGAKIPGDELYSPFVLIVARKGISPMQQRMQEAEQLAGAALAAIRREDLQEAEAHLRDCLKRDPEFLEPYVVLSDLLTARGDTEAARYVLEAAPKPMPNALHIVKCLGWNCLARDDRPSARAAFLEAVTWAPHDREVLDGLEKVDAPPARDLAEVTVETGT
jgi:asparagine synthase (glutamine-hydrolysing)